jgi:hypothetical protein
VTLRLTVLTAVAVALAASPAQAAVLNANKQCYREGDLRDPVIFGGGPFTPGGRVNVTRDGIPIGELEVNAAGNVSGVLTRPPIIDPADQRPFNLVATDQANPALTGTLTRLVSQVEIRVRPERASPATRRRITARGFTSGLSLYAHIRRGRSRRNVRIGALTAPCGTLQARRRLFRKGSKNGFYRVQFDTSPTLSPAAHPNVAFRVRIYTRFRRASSASIAERWVRLD